MDEHCHSQPIGEPIFAIRLIVFCVPQVRVRVEELPLATALWVCPESASDWEAANRDADALRDQVLMQVLAAKVGQRLPLWVHGTECIWVKVERSEPPAPAVRLAAGMDLIVIPPASAISRATPAASDTSRARTRWHSLRVGATAASTNCAAQAEPPGCSGDLSVGLSEETMRIVGVREGEHVWLRTGAKGREYEDGRRASPTSYAFGIATALPASAAPSAHAMLPLALRRQLGRELGAGVKIRSLEVTPSASSKPVPSPRVPTSAKAHLLRADSGAGLPTEDAMSAALERWLATAGHPTTAPPPSGISTSSTKAAPAAVADAAAGADAHGSDSAVDASLASLPLPQAALIEVPSIGLVQFMFDCAPPEQSKSPSKAPPPRGAGSAGGAGRALPGGVDLSDAELMAAAGIVGVPTSGGAVGGAKGAGGQAGGQAGGSLFTLHAGWTLEEGHSLTVGNRKMWTGAASGPGGGGLANEVRVLSPDWRDESSGTGGGGGLEARTRAHPQTLGGRRKDLERSVRFCRGAFGSIAGGASAGALMGLLVTGPRGVGKSAVVEAVAERLSWRCTDGRAAGHCATSARCDGAETGAPAWAATVPAEALLNATQPAALLVKLHTLFERARRCGPALIILEDLHKVLPATAAVPELATIPLAEATAELLASFAHEVDRPPVVIIATATSADRLHPSLRGAGLFDTEHKLGTPDRAARSRALDSLAAHLKMRCPTEASEWAASATEGCVAAGLRQLLDGARVAAAARKLLSAGDATGDLGADESVTIAAHALDAADHDAADASLLSLCVDDMKAALPHVTGQARASLDNGETTWSDVGVLEATKRVLIESVILPRDHPELFAGAPLRLTSGALLYGHSGCGKTLLAKALATEAGVPFLTVKGPELLNKYIGASEAAVRDLFERAAGCRPCIIFFDEFEAIAPRRGQDATGVTDRVVNQLLCELDGVESLQGVFVLAASNRPELIDPALLRPGRLDRKLLCPLPDLEERACILRALMRKAPCHESLRSETATRLLAARCDGFSGADLQALVCNAQFAAIHETIGLAPDAAGGSKGGAWGGGGAGNAAEAQSARQTDRVRASLNAAQPWLHAPAEWLQQLLPASSHPGAGDGTAGDPAVCIEQRHIDDSLDSARPSTSAAQLQERDAVFRSFEEGAGGMLEEDAEGSGRKAVLRAALRAVHA